MSRDPQDGVMSASPEAEKQSDNNPTVQRRQPHKQRTQEDQDADDDKARKQAQQELEKSWMSRLQLISVITTFFASTEASLLSITTPGQGDSSSPAEQAANAGLAGGLVFHSFAAILSFTAAFALIHYQIQEAKREQKDPSDAEKQEIFCSNPHLAMKRVGYFSNKEPPTHLLQRFHSLCIAMSVIGFVLAVAGILCFVWARQAESVGIFSSACLAACLVAGFAVIFMTKSERL